MIFKYLLLFIPFKLLIAGGNKRPNFIDVRIYDNTIDVDRLLYGDITRMDDLQMPPLNDEKTDERLSERAPEDGTLNDEIPEIMRNMDELKFPHMENSTDVKEFNEITKSIRNITDTYIKTPGILTRKRWFQDNEDSGEYNTHKEPDKKNKMINIMITFLIHARYQIKKGLKEKDPIRFDTRYRIGYLFNRLRHLQYEEIKLASAAQKQYDLHFTLSALTKLYEKLVHCDVDVLDTINYIQVINDSPDVHIKYPMMEQE